MVDFWGEKLRDQVSALCRLVPEGSKSVCYTALAGRLSDLFARPEERARVCESFELAYRRLCEQS